jgi:DNA (cytosine-5)-methyltransferase 1
MSKLRVFEAFSGVGTQSMALKRLGVDYEVVGIAEIDKFAIQSYMAIHGETKNYGDISKINPTELPDMDLFTYSFPCQDLSISGKQRGMSEGTRSGLLYECEKVITTKKPKYLLLENVKNLVGKKFKPDFDKWLEWLESQGYRNYWQVLNAKDYGVPQNRERVFVVSISGEGTYDFPESFPLEVKLKDILEDEVDEKYYLINSHIVTNENGKLLVKEATKLGYREAEEGDSINLEHPNSKTRRGRVGKQVAQTLTTSPQQATIVAMRGRYNSEGKVEQQLEPRKDNLVLAKKYTVPLVEGIVSKTRKDEIAVKLLPNGDIRPHKLDTKKSGLSELNISYEDNPSKTITTTHSPKVYGYSTDFRIRRLTPLECWRLMGITDEDFYKAKTVGMSDSQLYKQAGNAIVVDVLVGIFGNLFNQEYDHSNIKESAFEFSQIEFPFVYNNELEQLGRL